MAEKMKIIVVSSDMYLGARSHVFSHLHKQLNGLKRKVQDGYKSEK